jgi:hypothetical protein
MLKWTEDFNYTSAVDLSTYYTIVFNKDCNIHSLSITSLMSKHLVWEYSNTNMEKCKEIAEIYNNGDKSIFKYISTTYFNEFGYEYKHIMDELSHKLITPLTPPQRNSTLMDLNLFANYFSERNAEKIDDMFDRVIFPHLEGRERYQSTIIEYINAGGSFSYVIKDTNGPNGVEVFRVTRDKKNFKAMGEYK